ncbi:MAG: hypothetical protein K2H64_05685 [Desulfovibrio sp.]|nr:hypothetical protein [Desulfovibrio sp.]
MTTAFDALDYFEKLKEAGVPEEQAKFRANALKVAIADRVVARDYLDARLSELELKLSEKIESGKHETLLLLTGSLFAQSALIVAVLRYRKG